MGIESAPAGAEYHEETRAREYREVASRYQALKKAVPEAQEIVFRGKVAANDEERIVGAVAMEREAYEGEAEAYAQKGERHAERAMRMLEQLKVAEEQILGLYCDALHDSNELAELIRSEHPWVAERFKAVEDEHAEEEAA